MKTNQVSKGIMLSTVNGVCPHLGLSYDPEVCFAYPNSENQCHKIKKPAPVGHQHQDQVCLTEKYFACDVFQSDNATSLPRKIRLKERKRQKRRLLLGLFLTVLIINVALISVRVFSSYPSVSFGIFPSQISSATISLEMATPEPPTPSPEQSGLSPTYPILTQNEEAGKLRTTTPAHTSSPTPTHGPGFGTPFGPNGIYVLHEVKPGESFLFLANIYQTTTEVIKALNSRFEGIGLWVGEILVIMPGQTNPYVLPKFEVIQLDQTRTVNQLAEEFGILLSELQIYNSLGPDSDSIPSGRWLIIPVVE